MIVWLILVFGSENATGSEEGMWWQVQVFYPFERKAQIERFWKGKIVIISVGDDQEWEGSQASEMALVLQGK